MTSATAMAMAGLKTAACRLAPAAHSTNKAMRILPRMPEIAEICRKMPKIRPKQLAPVYAKRDISNIGNIAAAIRRATILKPGCRPRGFQLWGCGDITGLVRAVALGRNVVVVVACVIRHRRL